MNRSVTPAGLMDTLAHTIVGQPAVLEGLLLGLIANGHVLLEGPPGVAKTLACRTLAAALSAGFRRIQFTPDLLPSDIVGTRVFDQHQSRFETVLGPVFANVVLADEINRAPAKVQSALLEAMQERQVTIVPDTHLLPDPFPVLATMNPLDAEGTYALPLAQMDRFLLKLDVGYPSPEEERAILERFAVEDAPLVERIASVDDIRRWRNEAHNVYIDDALKRYMVDLVCVTRDPAHWGLDISHFIDRGASPRATLALAFLARAKAYLARRDYVLPDDVLSIAAPALRHRIGFNYRVFTENVRAEDLVTALIGAVPSP